MNEAPTYIWTPLASEDQPFVLDTPAVVRYGADTRWTEKTLAAGRYTANNLLFGDPAVFTYKTAQIRQAVSWVQLAAEGQPFTLTAASTVRYGVDTRWIVLDLPPGTYAATNVQFGLDPAVGVVKAVYRRALTSTVPAPVAPPAPVIIPPRPALTVNQNSVTLSWPMNPLFVSFRIYRQRGGRTFLLVGVTRQPVFTDQRLPDGERARYQVFGVEANGKATLIFDGAGQQEARIWKDEPLAITEGKVYSGNYRSTDPKVAAVTVAPGVKGWSLLNTRLRSRGHLVSVSQGSDGLVRNVIGWGDHPGTAGTTTGNFVNAYRPAGLTVEQVDFENVTLGYYVNGGGTQDVRRLAFRRWRSFNMNSRLTSADGYLPVRGYAGHIFQADHVFYCPEYDVQDGEGIQEYGVGMVEDGISNYVSSGIPSRRFRWENLCIFGMWPFDATAHPDTPEGYNAGCGLMIGDGTAPPNATDANGYGDVMRNLTIACGNAGIGVGGGSHQDVHHNRDIASGYLPDGVTVNPGMNVGMYLSSQNGLAAGTFDQNSLRDNASMHWCLPGSKNKPDGGAYNNAFDQSGADPARGNVAARNEWLTGDASVAREHAEHLAWHVQNAAAGVILGAQTSA